MGSGLGRWKSRLHYHLPRTAATCLGQRTSALFLLWEMGKPRGMCPLAHPPAACLPSAGESVSVHVQLLHPPFSLQWWSRTGCILLASALREGFLVSEGRRGEGRGGAAFWRFRSGGTLKSRTPHLPSSCYYTEEVVSACY